MQSEKKVLFRLVDAPNPTTRIVHHGNKNANNNQEVAKPLQRTSAFRLEKKKVPADG